MRVRAQCIVHRGNRLLLVQEDDPAGGHWCLPGGGMEEGETPEAAALRELWEECSVRGQILREVSQVYFENSERYHTFLVDIGGQTPGLPDDPELRAKSPSVMAVGWHRLDQLSEIDRAFLWTGGLLTVPVFAAELFSWSREVSYPASSTCDFPIGPPR
jgi:8-oxo-dGTP pyrophosphatase MutT (NUDIX family)